MFIYGQLIVKDKSKCLNIQNDSLSGASQEEKARDVPCILPAEESRNEYDGPELKNNSV